MNDGNGMTNQLAEDREDASMSLDDLLEELCWEDLDPEPVSDERRQWMIEAESRHRAEEAARLERRRPSHDQVLADVLAFARIPFSHLMGCDESAPEQSRAYFRTLLELYSCEVWSSKPETIGETLRMIEETYYDLEEYQPALMEAPDDGQPITIPWERPYYRVPDKGHADLAGDQCESTYYGPNTYAGRPDAEERATEYKAVLAQTMPLFTELMATLIDVLKRYDTTLHAKSSGHGSASLGEEPLDYDPPIELPAAAQADVLDYFERMGMSDDEAKTALRVLAELPYSEINDAIWTFYDDEEIYGVSRTAYEIDLAGGERGDFVEVELDRHEILDTFYNLACDCTTTIKTTGGGPRPAGSKAIAGCVRDLVARGRTAEERRALLAIGTFNALAQPFTLVQRYRMPR